ncbi:MAG: endonuclease/exonuclease/phosphatase family protein [Spirochaetes bacterium]|nr:endonuclease/exonuclease/phosphatase family protein [Spirochaetota bacterium]
MKRTTLAIAAILLSAVFAASAAAVPLKVLTYNLGLLRVFGFNFVPTVRERAELAPREIARFAAEQSVDVIVLQEIWKSSQVKAITEALAPLGYEVVRPKGCTLIGKEGGLLVAVRQPLRIVSWSFTQFKKSTFIDSLARKGVLQALVENPGVDGAQFVLLATHTVALDTDQGTPVDEKQVAALKSQAVHVLSILEQAYAAGSLPALLVGDFNVGPGYADASYRLIADAPGIREAGVVAAPGEALVTWDPGNPLVHFGKYPNEPAAKIDHIFMRDGSMGRWQAIETGVVFTQPVAGLALTPSKGAAPVPTPLSDHYGFLAELDLAGAR